MITIVNIVRTMSMYKHEHGYIPTEWQVYIVALNDALITLSVDGIPKELIMKNVLALQAKRLLWQSEIIHADTHHTVEELQGMSMVELRDLRDELLPMYIAVNTGTATGSSTTYTKVKAA
jgi:hypothetical protein